jgi:beta-glucosidase
MISFTSKSFVMLALVGALACGGSAAEEYCKANYLMVETATASSVESNHFVADWAVDGDPNSRWASDGPGADGAPERQWLKLDLGDIGFIDSINLQWERAYSRDYEIQVSNTTDDDDEEWETVANMSDIMDGYLENVQLSMLDVKARYVRILSTKGDATWGISLYEVKIFGDSEGECIAGPASCRQTGIVAAEAFASSEEGSHWGPENAIDGDRSTRWSSEFKDHEWLTVYLGEDTLVYSVWLFWERAYAGSYNLEASDSESGPWTTIFETMESDGEVDILEGLGEGLGVQTRYLRLLSTSRATRYGNSLWEFEVRGTKDNSCFFA